MMLPEQSSDNDRILEPEDSSDSPAPQDAGGSPEDSSPETEETGTEAEEEASTADTPADAESKPADANPPDLKPAPPVPAPLSADAGMAGDDILGLYLRELSSLDLLTREDEVMLATAYEAGREAMPSSRIWNALFAYRTKSVLICGRLSIADAMRASA